LGFIQEKWGYQADKEVKFLEHPLQFTLSVGSFGFFLVAAADVTSL
jgi:hypothetical protein